MKAFKHPLASIALLSSLPLAIAANAEENASAGFQHQVSYHNVSSGFSSLFDSDNTQVFNYRYYFDQVSTDSVPVALVDQLAQTSFANINWVTSSRTDTYALSAEKVFDNNWFVGGQAAQLNQEVYFTGMDLSAYSFEINGGYNFDKFTSVEFSILYSQDDESVSSATPEIGVISLAPSSYNHLERIAGIPPYTGFIFFAEDISSLESENYAYSVNASHYLNLEGEQGINFTGAYGFYDVSVTPDFISSSSSSAGYSFYNIDLAADWFISRHWSLGAAYNYSDGKDWESYDSVRAQTAYHYQFNNGVYLGAEYSYNFESDHELIILNAGWRF